MIIELLKTFLAWLVIFPVAFGIGSSFGPFMSLSGSVFRGVVYVALGFIGLVLAIVILGSFGVLSPTTIWSFLLVTLFLKRGSLSDCKNWWKAVWRSVASFNTRWLWLLNLLFIFSCVALLAGVLTPEIGGDALCYHLNLAKRFLQNHSIAPNYYDLNSYFAGFMNCLYAIGLATGGVFAAKLFHFFSGFFLFLSVRHVVTEETRNDILGTFAALVVWLTPTVYNLLSTTYVDVAVGFYSFLALVMLITALKEQKRGPFFVSGLLIGSAVGIKYLGFVSLMGLAAVWLYEVCLRRFRINLVTNAFSFGVGTLISSCFWYVRNWFLTGNPIFPFFGHFFGAQFRESNYSSYGLGRSVLDFVSVFFNMFYYPTAFGAFVSRTGILYFLFLPFALLAFFVAPRSRPYFIFLLVFMIGWFFICQAHRYVVPALPVLTLLGMFGMVWLYRFASSKLKKVLIVFAGIFGLVFLSADFTSGLYHYRYEYLPLLGRWSKEEYLLKMERTNEITKWANKNLEPNATILLEAEPNQFYFDCAVIRDPFLKLQTHYHEQIGNAGALGDFLKSIGITHILLSNRTDGVKSAGEGSLLRTLSGSSMCKLLYSVPSQNIRDLKYNYFLYQLN